MERLRTNEQSSKKPLMLVNAYLGTHVLIHMHILELAGAGRFIALSDLALGSMIHPWPGKECHAQAAKF